MAVTLATLGWGTVLDRAGNAVSNVEFSVSNPAGTTVATGVTNAVGQIPGTLSPGRYTLTVGGVGYGVIVPSSDTTLDVMDYGAIGDGVADDTAAVQAALDATISGSPTQGGSWLRVNKRHRITAPLTCTAKQQLTIDFGGGGGLVFDGVTGAGLTLTSCARLNISKPVMRYKSGALTAFLVLDTCPKANVNNAELVADADIPAGLDGIVVTGSTGIGCFYTSIKDLWVGKYSGVSTGYFRRGVSFVGQGGSGGVNNPNASVVIDGSINQCVAGVYVNLANDVEVRGTSFEDDTYAVQFDGATSNAGGKVNDIRCEILTGACVAITHTVAGNFAPIVVGNVADFSVPNVPLLYNPNNMAVVRKSNGTFDLRSAEGNVGNNLLRIQPGDNQGTLGYPPLEIETRAASSQVTSLTADPGAAGVSLAVTSTTGFPASGAVRLNHEVIAYASVTATSFDGCTRGREGTTAAAHAVGSLVRNSLNRTVAIDTSTGAITHRSSSSAPPTLADERSILHHRNFITKLISWRPDNTGASVYLSVGDGSGPGIIDVLKAYAASVRPGADDAIDLGLLTTRWRHLFVASQVVTDLLVNSTDAAFTLTPATSAQRTVFTAVMAANRTVTLSTTGAQLGMSYKVTRTAASTGAFTLDVGGLKSLATGQWCEVAYNGSAWVLVAYGAL